MKTTRTLLILFLLGISALAESQLPPPPPPPPPPSGSGKINKADSLVDEGDIKGAIAEYKKMYHQNPGDSRTAYNYACVLSSGSQADSAFRYLKLAVKSNPSATPLTDPDLLALREDNDRMRMNQNKPQRFGTHAYLDPGAGNTNELYPLEDESKVDAWRMELGLEPLKDYLARTGIKFKPSQAAKK